MITIAPMTLEHVPGYREGLGQVGRERRLVIDVVGDVWDLVQAVTVKGTFLCSQAVARSMIERDRGGRIINISSLAGQRWVARFAADCASKFTVRGLYTVRPVASSPARTLHFPHYCRQESVSAKIEGHHDALPPTSTT